MNSLPLISHRLYVAAINDENGIRTKNRRYTSAVTDPGGAELAAGPDARQPASARFMIAVPADSVNPRPARARAVVRSAPPPGGTAGS
jgi:hypothetical protein